jgi:hypothetical protein
VNKNEERAYNLIVEKLAWEHTGRCGYWNDTLQSVPISVLESMTVAQAKIENEMGFKAYVLQRPYHLSKYLLDSAIKEAFRLTYYRLTMSER